MSAKLYFIGNEADYKTYLDNGGKDVTQLPLKNLPMSYFPFFYNTSEASVEKMRKLVPLLENYTATKSQDQQNKAANYTIDTDMLFSLLTDLEEPYQPYNTYQINHIYIVVIILWLMVGIFFLKVFSIFLREYYIFFIVCMILVLLIFGVLWSLFVTNNVL